MFVCNYQNTTSTNKYTLVDIAHHRGMTTDKKNVQPFHTH